MRGRFLIVVVALLFLVNTYVMAQQPDTQTFTTEDGTFSFEYPGGWLVEILAPEYGGDIAVNNLSLTERYESLEGIALRISLPRKSYDFGFEGGETPAEMVAWSMPPGASQPATIQFSTPSADGTPQPLQVEPAVPDVSTFLIDGRQVAYAYSVMQVAGMDASQLIIVVDLGGDYWVSVSASSFKGGVEALQRYEPTILQIVQSMRYTPLAPAYSGNPDLPQVYSGLVGIWQRGSIQFFYPADWYVSSRIMVVLSNKEGNLLNTQPELGQFIAAIQGVSETIASVDQTELFNQCHTQSSDWTAQEVVTQLLGSITPAQLEQMHDAGIAIAQPEVVTINDVEIVSVRQYQGDIEALSIYVDLGDGYIPSMTVLAHQGEMAQFEDQLFAVASTFQYTPKPCDKADTGS